MNDIKLNDIEVDSSLMVRATARDFAAALAETPQFKIFEQAHEALSHDAAAQQALVDYQTKAESLRALLMLNAVSESERAELDRLKNDYFTRPTVQAYATAEAGLAVLCQQAAGMISEAVGLNYAAACGASCCG